MWSKLYYRKILVDREIQPHWDFWTIYKDDCDILGFWCNFSIKKLHCHPEEVEVTWSALPVGKNAIFWWRNSNKICEYHSHPHILSKGLNIGRISLSANIFSYYFGHTFPHFSETLKNLFFSLTTIHFQCQKLCILSHLSESFDVPAGWWCWLEWHEWFYTISQLLNWSSSSVVYMSFRTLLPVCNHTVQNITNELFWRHSCLMNYYTTHVVESY